MVPGRANWKVSFHAVSKFSPGQQHTMPARCAFQSNICTQADDLPGKPAAWMGFSQTYPVAKIQFGQHVGIITHVIIF